MSKLNGTGVARWLLITFAGVCTLVASVMWLSLTTSNLVQLNSKQLVQQGIPALEEIGDLESSASSVVNHLYLFYTTTDQAAFESERLRLSAKIERDLNLIRQHGISAEDVLLVEQIIEQLNHVIQQFTAEMSMSERDWNKLREHLSVAQTISDSLSIQLYQWKSELRNRARYGGQATLQEVSNLNRILIVFSAFISIVAGFVLFIIYGRIKDRDALFQLAYNDELTGLPNRQQLELNLDQHLAENKQGALLLIRVARYELLTTTYGHSTAQLLILHATQWLEQQLVSLPCNASIYRYGDDSWMIHSVGETKHPILTEMVEHIMGLSKHPISVEGRPFNMICTMGVGCYPNDGNSVEALLRNTQAALQDAVSSPSGYCFFDTAMTQTREQWLAMESALREALDRDEFELYYQVKVESQQSRAIGAEALIRWSRNGEMISPGQFIPIAERSGLILPIGNWVIEETCRQLNQWRAKGLELLPIAINISSQQFQQTHFPQLVADLLSQYQIEPALLELEITEEIAATQPEQVVATMNRLKSIGVTIALDDFGTGYSSLSYLQRFPIDTLKIDRSFIHHMGSCTESYAIINLLLSLARQMRYKVVAEGVETQEQYKTLQVKGCDMLQGFLFDKPQPVIEFEAYLLPEKKRG